MSFFLRELMVKFLGLIAFFYICVVLALGVFGPEQSVTEGAGEPVPMALSVSVEIIREGEDPALRRVEVRP